MSPNLAGKSQFYVGYSGRPAELQRLLSCGVPLAGVYMGGMVGKVPNAHRQYVESMEVLAGQVRMCHEAGVQIEILLDAPCFGGQHLWVRGQPLFIEYLRQLEQVAVDGVIASDPVIMELAKEHTELRVVVSHVAGVDSAFRAQFYERLGADAIILDPALNRQHRRLRQVIEALVQAQPRLLLNEGCFVECPYRQFQGNLASHPDRPIAGDYYLLNCTALRLEQPSLLLKSPTIRPEDVHNYGELGVGYCLAPRSARRTVSQSRILQAYAQGKYDGDFLDLLANRGYPILRNLCIPNRLLDGAWNAKWRDCLSTGGCGDCGFCDDLIAQVLEERTDDQEQTGPEMGAARMTDRLETLKHEFERLFREQKKYVLVDEAGWFVSGCGCRGLRVRPGGLRMDVLNSRGEQVSRLLIDTCSSWGVEPNLGYVQMVYGSRDLIDCLYMVEACPACRANAEESGGLAPITVFYDPPRRQGDA